MIQHDTCASMQVEILQQWDLHLWGLWICPQKHPKYMIHFHSTDHANPPSSSAQQAELKAGFSAIYGGGKACLPDLDYLSV